MVAAISPWLVLTFSITTVSLASVGAPWHSSELACAPTARLETITLKAIARHGKLEDMRLAVPSCPKLRAVSHDRKELLCTQPGKVCRRTTGLEPATLTFDLAGKCSNDGGRHGSSRTSILPALGGPDPVPGSGYAPRVIARADKSDRAARETRSRRACHRIARKCEDGSGRGSQTP